MSFSNIDNLNLGKFLQIAFSEGVRSQISEDYRDWEMINRARVGAPDGRQLNFLFQKSFGPGAVQYRNPNGSSAFPTAQQATTSEHSAVYKEIDVTIELEYNLWNRARKSPAKYAEPLAMEIQSKTVAAKRRLAADLYGDGTGVVGTVGAAVTDTTGAGGSVLVPLSTSNTARGHVGFFEYGDLLLPYNSDGTADNPTVTGTFHAWRVKSKDRRNNTVTLEAVNDAGTVLALTSSSLDSGDVFYRVGQPTILDLGGAISDFGTATEVIAGLESLTANDGRTIHGITMSGATAGTVVDAGANALDVSYVQQMMDDVKLNVGQSVYSWKMLVGAPEAHAAFIESRESDRRFQSVADAQRGIKVFSYIHGNDTLEMYTSEYCPKKRLYALPENKSNKGKVIEYHGTDFEPVSMGGKMGEWHLKPSSSGGHERKISSYMEALGVLICKHPAAIGRLENFTA
jgi:hypothetical protein